MNRPPARLLLFTFLFAVTSVAQQADVNSSIHSFLDSYVKGDRETVLRSVDENTTVFGSDVDEVFHGRSAFESMLENDTLLWGGKAHFGEMRDVSVAKCGDIQTIFFNTEFAVGDQPPVPLRFCMVWRKVKGRWLLVQSSSAVVTEGQSAQSILKNNAR